MCTNEKRKNGKYKTLNLVGDSSEPKKKCRRTFRLCYVKDGILYFTDRFDTQWGDDWDDAPYEHNAGSPYEGGENSRDTDGVLRLFAYEPSFYLSEPKDGYMNSPFSVKQINKKFIPWLLYSDGETKEALFAGETIPQAKAFFKKTNIRFGELR